MRIGSYKYIRNTSIKIAKNLILTLPGPADMICRKYVIKTEINLKHAFIMYAKPLITNLNVTRH